MSISFIAFVTVVSVFIFEIRLSRALPANLHKKNGSVNVESINDIEDDNELLISFVVFRHGDRTPDPEELEKYPSAHYNDSVFHPFGKKALTLKGKQRAYKLGQYLRKRYNDSLSQLYLPNEIDVRTTDFARTKMTALAALAAMYPPLPEQKWHAELNWQPIPYYTRDIMNDDLTHFANCRSYDEIKDSVYELPEIHNLINSYQSLFQLLTEKTATNITNPENVFYLDNLFQALENVGVKNDEWIESVLPQIKEMTKIEYYCKFYNNDLVKLSTGVLLEEIVNIMKMVVAGDGDQAKLRLYSAHEVNVAALLSALKSFNPHQPKYCSSIALELRRNLKTGEYGVMAVYAADAGEPGEILPIGNCDGKLICDYDIFVNSIQDVLLPRSQYKERCLT